MRFSGGERLIVLGLSLLGLLPFANAVASEPVALVPGTQSVLLAGHIAVLRDENAEWTLDDVRSTELSAQFVPSDAASFNQGFTDHGAYWYRFALRNPADVPTDWVLQIAIPVLDYVDINITSEHSGTETILTGDLRRPSPRQFRNQLFAIPIKVPANELVTVHLRVQTIGRHQVRLHLWSPHGFADVAFTHTIVGGAIYGVLLIMALYNLIIFVTVRDRTYLYFCLWIAASLGTNIVLSGAARNYGNDLSAGAPAVINAAGAIALAAIGAAALLFARQFLQLARHTPQLHRFTSFLLALTIGVVLAYPILGFANVGRLGVPISLLIFTTLLIASAHLSRKGVRAARFYLLAWGFLIAAYLYFGVNILAGPVPGLLTQYSVMIGTIIAVTVFSYSLADRINSERREQALASERASRLKSFLPQKVADLVSGGDKTLLEPKRRNVTVLVMDLRGFTPFSETTAPEDVMNVLREFYSTMGDIVEKHDGTVEHFAGDSMLVFFNAPLEIPNPDEQAIRAALDMRDAFEPLRGKWAKHGHELGLGVGIADGYATIGAIGFSGRSQYAAIGAVTNLASRLCGSASHGEILTTSRVQAAVENIVEWESVGEQSIKGFTRPVAVVKISGLKPPA